MDDFSFYGDGGPRRASKASSAQAGGQPGAQPGGGSSTMRIQIPSFSEVQAAQQPKAQALNSLFQPKGLLSGQPQQQHTGPQGTPVGTPYQAPPTLSVGTQGAAAAYNGGPAQHHAGNSPYPALQAGASTLQPSHTSMQQQGSMATTVSYNNNMGTSSSFTGAYQQGQMGVQSTIQAANPNSIVVSKRQQGNPVLKHIRNVRWVFGDTGPDYLLGANACALFLSLRYHLLHPNYILYRIKELGRAYGLRVVLVQVDVEDVVKPLADITKAAALNDCTLICAWSAEEAARYLETYKAYENKPATHIQERVDADYASRLAAALTAVRAVNRTDALALGGQFGTLASVLTASKAELSSCPGIGPTKVQNMWDAFNKPFRSHRPAAAPAAAASSLAPNSQLQQPAPAVGQQHGSLPAAAAAASTAQGAQQQGTGGPAPRGAHDQLPQVQRSALVTAATGGQLSLQGDMMGSSVAMSDKHGRGDGIQQVDSVLGAHPSRSRAAAGSSLGASSGAGHDAGRGHGPDLGQGALDDDGGNEGTLEEELEDESTEGEEALGEGDEGDDLVHLATQRMLHMAAGALAVGVVDSDGEGEGDAWGDVKEI